MAALKSPQNESQNIQNIEEWSDKRCLEISRLEMFPAIVKDLKVQKNIISRFLNFYLGGKVQKGLSPRDLIFAVISMMPISAVSEMFLWAENEYSEDGKLFFLTPDDKLQHDINIVVKKSSFDIDTKGDEERRIHNEPISEHSPETDNEEEKIIQDELISELSDDCKARCIKENIKVDSNNENVIEMADTQTERESKTDLQKRISSIKDKEVEDTANENQSAKSKLYTGSLCWYRLKRERYVKEPSVETKYTPVDNAAFCIYFNKLLDEWDISVESRIRLKFFFAMAALFLMRGKVKTCQKVTKYFSTKFHSDLYINFNCYVAPHKDFIKKSWKCFRENDNRTSIMFAKLVILSLAYSDRLDKYGKVNIIFFAVLSHTVYSGMGIINMLQQLASISTTEFQFMFNMMYTEETAVSWNKVNDFFKKYLCQESKRTCHWAGIISSDTFANLSCNSNYVLAVVIAVFIEKLTNNVGVWQSAWVSKGNNLEACKQLGYKIYNKYNDSKINIFDLPGNLKLLF